MNKDWSWPEFWSGVSLSLMVLLCILFIRLVNSGGFESPEAVSGRVEAKLEIFTGYGTGYVLQLEVAENRYLYIAVNAKVWHLALEGVSYEFVGGSGNKYTSIAEVKRE